MSRLKLYLDTLSQPCRAVNLFLLVNKIPFETKLINLGKGKFEQHRVERYGTPYDVYYVAKTRLPARKLTSV